MHAHGDVYVTPEKVSWMSFSHTWKVRVSGFRVSIFSQSSSAIMWISASKGRIYITSKGKHGNFRQFPHSWSIKQFKHQLFSGYIHDIKWLFVKPQKGDAKYLSMKSEAPVATVTIFFGSPSCNEEKKWWRYEYVWKWGIPPIIAI